MVKNTCPVKRRPIDNKCIELNTYIKKNKQWFDCCYKIRNKKNEYSLDKEKTISYTSAKENSKRAATKAEKPEKKAKEPKVKTEKPEKKAKETAKKVKETEKKAKEPKVKAEKPEKKVKEPKVKAEKPEKKAKEPKVKTEKPEKKAKEPKVKAEKPEKKVKETAKKVKETEKKVKEPKVKVEKPEKKVKEPKVKETAKKVKEPKVKVEKPAKKSSSPKEAKKKTTPTMEPVKIHYNFENKLDKLLNELSEEIEYRITKLKNKNFEYEQRIVLELNALDSASGTIDNIINILKTKFKTLKIVEKDDTMAILRYKKVYIGFHNKTYENNNTTILFGCDITDEDISNWFSQEGRFEDDSYHDDNSEGVYDDDQDDYDVPASPYKPKKKLSKNFLNNFDMMLEQLKKNVDECIRDGVQSEYYEHEVFESNTADPDTANINNLINLLKTKFSPLKIIQTSKRLAIVRYKKIYIGMHTNKQVSGVIDILFGCDATEEGISDWFSQDGSF